jgi:beta-galactosidase
VTGECADPVRGLSVKLQGGGAGWKVAPTEVQLDEVGAGQTRTATFTVTPPATADFGDYTLTATTTFTGGDPITATAHVKLPLKPGQRWASDLPFVGTPVNGWGPVERDTSNGEDAAGDGIPLQVGQTPYEKGFGAHANSSITLDVPAGCTRFDATVGVDAEVGGAGSVKFEVRAGDALLASTGVLAGGSAGVPVTAEVNGISRVDLVVSDAGDGNGHDHADWAAARFSC